MQSIKVRHNMEMAHRLSQTPGKCAQIHGHSWWVELEIIGLVDERGMLEGLDYGKVKAVFRGYLDETFDHHLLLNKNDTLTDFELPGTTRFEEDPTTENVARHIGTWAQKTFDEIIAPHDFVRVHYRVVVWETSVNCATWES